MKSAPAWIGGQLMVLTVSVIWALGLSGVWGGPLHAESTSNAKRNDQAKSPETQAQSPVPPGRDFQNGIGMQMVWLPAGYWVGRYEVTQAEYEKVMGVNPSHYRGPRRPAEDVSWPEAMKFCKRLNEGEARALAPGWKYTLPTEKQWEYFVADAQLRDAVHSRWKGRVPLGTSEVGSLKANQLGLFDVRGNVWEWCLDWWDSKKNEHVIRGGAWDLVRPDALAALYRPVTEAALRNGNCGFRCVLIAAP